MSAFVRRFILAFAVVVALGGASSAYADSYRLTFTSGLTGVLNLSGTPEGPGVFLVTGVTGSENGLPVGGEIAPNPSGVYTVPDGDGFTYDDLLFPGAQPVFDNAGLLFFLDGPGGVIFENLYSVGGQSYLESGYLNNGKPFPGDFSYVPVTFSLSPGVVSKAAEPSALALCLVGLVALAFATRKKKLTA